jgi:hypothetical protein
VYYALDNIIREAKSHLYNWDFTAVRVPYNKIEDPDDPEMPWNEDLARECYGTWEDEDGEVIVCKSAAEQTLVQLISIAESERTKSNTRDDRHRFEIERLKGIIKDIKKFACMNDRELGIHMLEHVEAMKKDEGQETLGYTPHWLEYVGRRLK